MTKLTKFNQRYNSFNNKKEDLTLTSSPTAIQIANLLPISLREAILLTNSKD